MGTRRTAAVRLRLLGFIGVGVIVVGASAYGIRQWQRERQIESALTDGLAAYEKGDWAEAGRLLGRYVGRRIDDCQDPKVADVCKKFAEALLATQPLEPKYIRAAISTYRRLLRDGGYDRAICDRLAMLYLATGDPAELEYVAKLVAEQSPGDARAEFWLAQAAVGKQDAAGATKLIEGLLARLDGKPGNDEVYVEACLTAATLAGPAGQDESQKWLDRALARDSGAASARVARGRLLRQMAQARQGEERERLLSAAEADLAAAERAEAMPILARLALCDELRGHGKLARAKAQVAKLADVSTEEVRATYLDATDWRQDLWLQRIYLLAAENDIMGALAEAERALAEITTAGHRQMLLPVAMELAAAKPDVTLARKRLEEYLPLIGGGRPEDEALKAQARALVQMAEGDGYGVIALLEPLKDTGVFTTRMRDLLAGAYQATGQQSRVAALYASTSPGEFFNRSAALASVQALLAAGHVESARSAIADLEQRYPDETSLKILRIEAEMALASTASKEAAASARQMAISALRELAASHPKELKVQTRLASLLAVDGQIEAAEQTLKRTVASLPDSADAKVELAGFYIVGNRIEDAARVLEDARQANAKAAEPWLISAELLSRQGKRAEARDLLEAGLSAVAEASRPGITRRLGMMEALEPDTREAGIGRLHRLAESNPKDLETRSLLLGLEEVQKNGALSQRLVDEIKAVEGELGLRWRLHAGQLAARTVVSQGESVRTAAQGQAETLLNYCIQADATWPAPVMVLGGLHEYLNETEAAERLYRKSMEARPSQAVADRLIALLERERRYKDAIEVMDRYAAVMGSADYSSRRLTLAAATKDLGLIEAQLEMQEVSGTGDPRAKVLAATIQFARDGDVDAAERALDEAETSGADPVMVAAARARILRSAGQEDAARKALDRLIAAKDSFDARVLRGSFLTSIGETAAAEADYRALKDLAKDAKGFAYLGQYYAEQGNFSESIATSEAGLKRFPESVDLKRGMAKALVVRHGPGDLERAGKVIDGLSANERDTSILYVEAVIAEMSGGPEAGRRVRAILESAAKNPSGTVQTYSGLIALALRAGQAQVAESLLNAARREHGSNEPLLLTAEAMQLMFRGEAVAALAPLRQAAAQDPTIGEIYELALVAAPIAGDAAVLGEFVTYSERAIQRAPDSTRLRLAWARMLQRLGRSKEAAAGLAAYVEGQKEKEAEPGLLLTLADLRRDAGQYDEAEKVLSEVERGHGDDLGVKAARLDLLGAQGRQDEVAALAREVIEDNQVGENDRQMFVMHAAQYLISGGDGALREEAAKLHHALIQKQPKAVPSRLALALIYAHAGQTEAMVKVYREVLEIDPNRDEALNNLAWLLLKDYDNPREAEPLAVRAVAQSPKDPTYRDTLGEVLLALGDRGTDARVQFAEAANLWPATSPEKARALLKLARVCKQLGATEEAIDHLASAKRIDSALRVASAGAPLNEKELEEVDQLTRELASGSR